MEKIYRIAIGQINLIVGDLEGNYKKIKENIEMAKSLDVDIIAFPELAITGCPPEDLLLKTKFIDDNLKFLNKLAMDVYDIVAVVGFVDKRDGRIFNAASIIYNGNIKGVFHKMFLTNQGVFDERRYFTPGTKTYVANYAGLLFGVNISEDIWHRNGPVAIQAASGATLIINISASPYYVGKINLREKVISRASQENSVFVVYANLVGGQDEIIYDGQSFVMDKKGKIIAKAMAFKEDLLIVDLLEEELIQIESEKDGKTKKRVTGHIDISSEIKNKKKIKLIELERHYISTEEEEVYNALILGLSDYTKKNGFKKVVLGISGGIDSALVATIAVDALGRENVTGLFMPSRFTSDESLRDAVELASNLHINLIKVPIDEIYESYLRTLEPFFKGLKMDITEENIQARIRGNILMAFSNKFGWLVLTTGNKSEMSVGYATLYGDMAGGFAVLKDVPKTMVYKLGTYRNSISPVIPENIMKKEPTAELRPNQKDTDTLPPYEKLDPIIKMYVEDDLTIEEIISKDEIDKSEAERVISMIDVNEYKRRQSPPGIKITPRAFGRDRRMPITNKYRLS
ncbi:MAG TPA: NAD+ synthase [Syntrophorhabdaceae bacterium]|nr:NAD+ synthase [Syntrophorhabdaceae bacterium]